MRWQLQRLWRPRQKLPQIADAADAAAAADAEVVADAEAAEANANPSAAAVSHNGELQFKMQALLPHRGKC